MINCKRLFGSSLCSDEELYLTKMLEMMIAFSPPEKITYTILPFNCANRVDRRVDFIHSDYDKIKYPYIDVECYYISKTGSSKHKIVLLHIKNKRPEKSNITVIHSHGISSDLGGIYPFLFDFSTQLQVDVIAYDYSGYGRSEGKPSEKEMYSDIESVMQFSITQLNLHQENIVLLGKSLGAAPSVHIAISSTYHKIKGLILLSPISNAVKLVDFQKSFGSVDLNKLNVLNIMDKGAEISCPVLVIHGKADNVIPFQHINELLSKIKTAFKFFPKGGTHNNIITEYRTKFYIRLREFFEILTHHERNVKRQAITFHDTINCNSRKSEKLYQYCTQMSSFGEIKINKQEELYDTEENKQKSDKGKLLDCISIKNNLLMELDKSIVYSISSEKEKVEPPFDYSNDYEIHLSNSPRQIEYQFNTLETKLK